MKTTVSHFKEFFLPFLPEKNSSYYKQQFSVYKGETSVATEAKENSATTSSEISATDKMGSTHSCH